MSLSDLLAKLEQEGAGLELSLRGGNLTDEHRTFITEHRDDLITALALKRGLYLPAKMLESLLTWTEMYHELRITHPDGLTINAKPEHVRDALKLHAWGVVHFSDKDGRWLVLSWGNVPTHALMELHDLDTGALLIADQVAA